MLREIAVAVFVLPALCAVPSLADEATPPNIIGEDWACGTDINPTPYVTRFFTPNYVFQNDGGAPTFLAGTLRDPDQGNKFSALFVRTGDGWRGYAVEGQASFSNAYVASDGSRAVLFSMWDVEAPGQSYTVISSSDGFKTVTCGELPAPDTRLDILDYMQISSLDLDDKGNGLLRGFVRFSEDRPTECFTATTGDGGANWTVPKRTDACIDSSVMELAPVPMDDGPLAELRMYFGN